MRKAFAPVAHVANVAPVVPVIVVALFVFLSLTLLSAQQRSGSFAVAVLRRDGVLIPFAAFDGKRWGNKWPPPRLDLQVPINLTSVPKAWWGPTPPVSEWQIWTTGKPATIHVTQPDWVDAHCLRQVALRTDYRSDQPVPPPTEQPYPKDGLAVSPPQALERIEIVAAGAAAAPLTAGVREKFNEAELETDGQFGHPISRRSREGVEPTIEALYAFGEHPRAYYVEASRMYRKAGDEGCTAIAFGTGWFVKDVDKIKWLDMAVDLLRCDKYGATYMLPLGGLRIDGRSFWIVQYSGWDHERYVVAEVKKDKVDAVVSAWGGGC